MRLAAPIGLFALALLATPPAHAAELTGTLQKIKETNTIVLGVRDTSIPFSYIDDKQQFIGYAVDICMKIVDAIKKEIDAPTSRSRKASSPPRTASP